MAKEYINRSGYEIKDNPLNNNPDFTWMGDGQVDPTIAQRVSNLEEEMTEATEDIADLETAMAAIPETYATQTQLGQGLSNLNNGMQQQINGINERFDNFYPKTQTYNKSEVDALIPDVNNLATKTELTNGLATKANVSDIPDMTNYYTKSQTDALIPDVNNLATKTELTNGLATKANVSDIPDMTNYYTKTQADSLIPDLTNYYTKSETNALIPDMTNYYTKSESYNKTEIDNMIGAAITALEAI